MAWKRIRVPILILLCGVISWPALGGETPKPNKGTPTDAEVEASPEYKTVIEVLSIHKKQEELPFEQVEAAIDRLFLLNRKALPALRLYQKRNPGEAQRVETLIQAIVWDEQRLGYDKVVAALGQRMRFGFSNETLPEIAKRIGKSSGLPTLVALDALDFKGRLAFMGMKEEPLWNTLHSPILFFGFHVVVTKGGLLISRQTHLTEEDVVDNCIPYLEIDDFTNRAYAAFLIVNITDTLKEYSPYFSKKKRMETMATFKAWWESWKKRPLRERTRERREREKSLVKGFKTLLNEVKVDLPETDLDDHPGTLPGVFARPEWLKYTHSAWFLRPELKEALSSKNLSAVWLSLYMIGSNRLSDLSGRVVGLLDAGNPVTRVLAAWALAGLCGDADRIALHHAAGRTKNVRLKQWIGSLLISKFHDKYGFPILFRCLTEGSEKQRRLMEFHLMQLTYNSHHPDAKTAEDSRKAWEAWFEEVKTRLVVPKQMSAGFIDDRDVQKAVNALDGSRTESFVVQVDMHSWNRETFRVSPDVRRFAYASRRPGGWRMVVDGREGELFHEILAPVFSGDGKRIAYWAQRDGKRYVVVDGKAMGPYDGVVRDSVGFSPDGREVVFTGVREKKYFLVRGKKEGPLFDGLWALVFSPDGRRWAHAVHQGEKERIIVDGKPGKAFDHVYEPVFSPDGKRIAYKARRGKKSFLILDGREGKVYDNFIAVPIRFSPDGKRVIHGAIEGEKHLIVLNKREWSSDGLLTEPVFSPSGKRFACAVLKGGKAVVLVNGKEIRTHDDILSEFFFSPDGSRMAYLFREGEGRFLQVEEQRGESWFRIGGRIIFSPDGKRIACVAKRDNCWHAVVDGKAGKGYEDVGYPVFSPDGKHVAYVAYDGQADRIVLDGKEGPAYSRIVQFGHGRPLFDGNDRLRYLAMKNRYTFLVEHKVP
ncbi:MAG: WD40 repeat domain-containing protein [Planctomycetota bacterium]|jgi:Tol biopolymer transport system component